jgi:GTPase SAR1 family protein
MSYTKLKDKYPLGFKLIYTLRGHEDVISRVAWSPDGKTLASGSYDKTICLWDLDTGKLRLTLKGHSSAVLSVAWSLDGMTVASGSYNDMVRLRDLNTGQSSLTLEGHSSFVYSVAWSPDGKTLASGSADRTIRLWDPYTGKLRLTLQGHSGPVSSVAWSPDGKTLASGSADRTIRLWDPYTGKLRLTLEGHSNSVYSVAWSPDGKTLASGSHDKTIRLWDPDTGKLRLTLEGHTEAIASVCFSSDGGLLASKSGDGTVRLWHCDSWETAAILKERASGYLLTSLAFHPQKPILVTLGEEDTLIRIWELDLPALIGVRARAAVKYTNAKVVLIGDSGVGKSGLALVLTRQPFAPTDSTHGRRVWTFEDCEVELDSSSKEKRETFLWDLAGQPGYRIIHQLQLNQVAVALVVFDARSEIDPFAGVRHWDRALKQAQLVRGGSAPVKKFLVAARTDRGGIGVSKARIEALVQELGFDGYFETSAKEGWSIRELSEAIHAAIDWDALPKVRSTQLFQDIKKFLVGEKEAGRLICPVEELYHTFLRSGNAPIKTEELRAQFETCVGRVEAQGLIRWLGFGNLVLLQPELLDAYASAMVNTAKEEPEGTGSIAEEVALAGRFRMPEDERVPDKEQEKLLLIATVEEMLRHEIALREHAEDGQYLVFPSQFTRENPDLPDPEGKAVVFTFEGPLMNIYATLAVRLSHSGAFIKEEMWKNAVVYTAAEGETCGVFLHEREEWCGELVLFFNEKASEQTRHHFEEFILTHLQRRALPESILRRRIFVCPECATPVTDLQAQRRRERGFDWIECNVCGERVSLLDQEERMAVIPRSIVFEMDRNADAQRERETAATILQGKIATDDFDVFISYNGADAAEVRQVVELLKERGILPWFDEEQARPGFSWQKALEKQIKKIKSAAVFVGAKGVGSWQEIEQEAFLREFVSRNCPVIPVILASGKRTPKLPIFLNMMAWVDFRKPESEPLERLIWGITGERSPFPRPSPALRRNY